MLKKVMNYTLLVVVTIWVLPMIISLYDKNYYVDDQETKEVIILKSEIIGDTYTDVCNPETEIIEELGLEEYIKGVVAAEMPVSFEKEALKAQAVAARTYALRRLQGKEGIDKEEIAQAYLSEKELKERWGEKYLIYKSKIDAAVEETEGEIMTYEDEIIEAVFHSTSAGYTENSENLWNEEKPYLKSVESKQDEKAPDYIVKTIFENDAIVAKLEQKYSDIVITNAPILQQIQVIKRSEAGYIMQIQIGNKIFTGNEIRVLLGLRSTNFTVNQKDNKVTITTRGYGHGIGMSQYGANYMAQDGKNYKEILKHYYQGVDIVKYVE